MELRQLRYFEAVARQASFTQAARELHIAQPAVSAQVRSLEREWGTPLFERTTRAVRLTQAGQLALRRARRILDDVHELEAELRGLAAVPPTEVHLGAATALGPLRLPEALSHFRRNHPTVRVTVRTGFMPDLIGSVDAGSLDVALGPLRTDLPPRLLAGVLAEESLVLISPPGSAGAGRPTADGSSTAGDISLRELTSASFVCLPKGNGLRALLDDACRAAGFDPAVVVEAPDPRTLRAYVSAGLGVGVIGRSDATAPGPPVCVHRLRAAPAHPPIAAVYRAGSAPSAGVRALLTALTAEAGRPRPEDSAPTS